MDITNLRKKQIYELTNSLLKDYKDVLDENDLNIINSCVEGKIAFEQQNEALLPIVRKVWEKELDSGEYIFVSWNKSNYTPTNRSLVTFATISKRDDIVSYCNLDEGIQYEVTFDAIIGALNKDGATVIEDESKKNAYTIGIIDGKAINSYNGATKLITPKQLFDSSDNEFRSKHNEVILDSKLIREIGSFSK